jgi:predicted metal-dependent phosphoesterase TrpH
MTKIRVAAHVHSEWSYDAAWSLDSIAKVFARRNFGAVLMSEHDRGFDQRRLKDYRSACAKASSDRILLVPGIEYEDRDGVVHTPVWGDDVAFLGEATPTLELLRAARREGGVAVFAHPWRRNAFERYQSEWAPLLSAVEVWNRRYDGFAPHPSGQRFVERTGLNAFVSLDFHTRREFFPLAMTIEFDGRLTTAAVADAIQAGRARPEFLGISALLFTRGLPAATLRALETLRRGLRRPVRAIEGRLGR